MEWAEQRRQMSMIDLLAIYQNIMKQAQLKITAHIHNIKLQVRFPCSVTASLRIQHEQIPYGQQVPLRLGEALFEMAASHQFTVLYDSQRNAFQQKKISVLLFLKSSSGRIPAGAVIVSLNSIGQIQTKQSYGVEKCPDKQAAVQMSISCECLNEIDCVPLNPLTNRSNKSDHEVRMSFGNQKKKALKMSMMRQEMKSHERQGEHSIEGQSKQLKSSHSGARLDLAGDGESPFRSPSKAHFNDYASKSKIQQLERQLKNVQNKYQQQNLELKGSLAKKQIMERSLKDTEGQLRIIREKYSDLQTEHQNYIKKSQFRDGSLREQVKILTQKLAHAESQIQKMIFEKNDLVNDFEERERDLRFGLRQREKGVNQDKIKLSKKLQQVTNLYNQLKNQNIDGDARQAELVKELSKQKKRCEDEQIAKADLSHEVNILKDQLNSEKQQRKQLQQALSSNEQLEEEKKKFRKKIGDLEQELNIQIKNNSSSEATAQRNIKKCEQLQQTLKEKLGIAKNLTKEVEGLNREIQMLKSSAAEREKKLDETTTSRQKEVSKLEGSAKQLGQNLRRVQEELAQHKKRIKEKQNIIASLNEQMQTDFDDISNINKKNGELQIQLAQKNSHFNQLNYEHQELSLQKDNLVTQKAQLEVQLDSYIHDLEEIQKEYQSTSIQREEERKKYQKQIATLKHRIQNSSEESSFHISELQRKVESLDHQITLKSQQLGQKNIQIQNLEGQKMKNRNLIEQQEHSIKLKENQISFLNQSLQKANQDISTGITQNKEFSIEIDKLKKNIEQLTLQLQQKIQQLNTATSSGSSTQQQLQQYKQKNIENLTAFLQSIDGGLIQVESQHQDGKVLQLMLEATERNNLQVKEKNKTIQELEQDLQNQKEQNKTLNSEIEQLDQSNQELNKDFQETADQLNVQIKKNASLNQNMKILEETFQKQKDELMNSSQSQADKLNQKVEKLQTQLAELKGRFQEQTKNLNQSKQQLAKTKKQLKQYTNNSSGQVKSLKSQLQKLQTDVQKKRKEIESKASTILRYGDIQKELRDKIQENNKQITSLKDLNESIRKRNEKGTNREKQLEGELSKIRQQKEVQTKKEESTQKHLRGQIQSLKESAKAKEEQIKNLEHNLRNAQTDGNSAHKAFKEKQTAFNQKIKELQVSLDQERRSSSKEVERLTKLSQDADKMKEQLEEKISEFMRMLEQKEKIQHLEEEHLKPIKEQLTFLKGYMAEYSRVGDQFEGSKNKLLKLAHTRLQQYSDRNVAEKLREVSFVFQKLKAFLLFSMGLSEKQKEGVGEELKKMQFSLDRSLRGDR